MRLYIFVIGIALSLQVPAQDVDLDKIEQAKQLFSVQLSNVTNEQQSKTNRFFEQCSDSERQAIRAYMVKAITDSLTADNKQFAINYIDYYRMIASPDDEYLGSLVVTEGRYYYDLMDELKLSELIAFLNDIVSKTDLDYSKEISELNNMMNEVLFGCQDLEGYWVADFSDKEKADPFFVNIYRDFEQNYHVDIIFIGNNLWRYVYPYYSLNYNFLFRGTYKSIECLKKSPGSLSFCWASENLKIGKENLTTALRSGVRSVSNSVVGELARSNTYSFGTSLLGSAGAMVGEVVLNSLIDELAVSKKTIQTIVGEIEFVNENILSASLSFDHYMFRSDNVDTGKDNCQFKIKLIRCDFDDDYINNNIAFIDNYQWLRQRESLSKAERRKYYYNHPEVRKTIRKISNCYLPWGTNKPFKTMRAFNRDQLEKLKEYNKTH